jgi:hypothetical protein
MSPSSSPRCPSASGESASDRTSRSSARSASGIRRRAGRSRFTPAMAAQSRPRAHVQRPRASSAVRMPRTIRVPSTSSSASRLMVGAPARTASLAVPPGRGDDVAAPSAGDAAHRAPPIVAWIGAIRKGSPVRPIGARTATLATSRARPRWPATARACASPATTRPGRPAWNGSPLAAARDLGRHRPGGVEPAAATAVVDAARPWGAPQRGHDTADRI